MDIEMIEDRVLVKPLEKSRVTNGGIHIPATANTGEAQWYKVAAVGPEVKQVREGDTVAIGYFVQGQSIRLGEELYASTRETELLCVVGRNHV